MRFQPLSWAEYAVGIFWSWGSQKPLCSPLCCHLPCRILSYCAGELAASLWGFWENLTGRKVLKPAWQTRSHRGLGKRGWLAQNQLQGACFHMMFYVWKIHFILRKKHSSGKFLSPLLQAIICHSLAFRLTELDQCLLAAESPKWSNFCSRLFLQASFIWPWKMIQYLAPPQCMLCQIRNTIKGEYSHNTKYSVLKITSVGYMGYTRYPRAIK